MFTEVNNAIALMNIEMNKKLKEDLLSYYIISIAAVLSKGSKTSVNGVRTNRSIENELATASLSVGDKEKMNALVRLVTKGSKTYHQKLTINVTTQMSGSTHTIYSGNDFRARKVERYCQWEIADRERKEYSSGFKFRLMQSTPGAGGDLTGGGGYTVGIRFIKCTMIGSHSTNFTNQ